MPTKRIRRARRRVVAELPPACWRFLCGLPEPGDESSEDMIGFEFFDDPMSIEEAWSLFGEEATAAHARARPGSRPPLWWRHSAPEGERLDGPRPWEWRVR
jgi:hypothetical protein